MRAEAGPQVTGMLVVESVVPGGPSDNILEAGDIVVRLNGVVSAQCYTWVFYKGCGWGDSV